MEGFREILRRYRDAFSQAWLERHANQASVRQRSEADFLPAVLEVQESPPNPLARATLCIILLLLLLIFLWMVFGKIDIVAIAPGKIIPDNRIKVVQSAEGGVVRAILVSDGDAVRAGQTLFLLDDTRADADMSAVTDALQGFRLEEEMARLLTEDLGSSLPQLLGEGIDAARVLRQQRLLSDLYYEHRGRLGQMGGEVETARRGLEGERRGLSGTRARLAQEKKILASREARERQNIRKLENLLPLVQERYDVMRGLFEKGSVSKIQMREAQERHITISEDLAYHRRVLEEVQESGVGSQLALEQEEGGHLSRLSELEGRLEVLERSLDLAESTFRREMGDRQEGAARQIEQLEQELVKSRASKARHEIRAPVDGLVQQLALHTEGGVVQPAQALLVIVPEKPSLEIEARVENKDIGFVREGQSVEIKVDAFPYTKYGLIEGVLLALSADAIENETGGLVYQARVQLSRDTIVVDGKEVRLSPGMSVVVEIKTGKRRVIEFFLSPLQQHSRESLGER